MCFTQLSDLEETYTACPYCEAIYYGANEVVSGTYLINCLNPNCTGFIEYSDEECYKCGVEFNEQDWDLYLQQATQEEIEIIQQTYSNNDPIMICCGNKWVNCNCDKPVDWDDTDKIPIDIWNKIYSESSTNKCDICELQYSQECIPLTNFIVNFIHYGVIGDKLTECSDFFQDELLPVSLEDQQTLMFVNYGEF